MRKEKNIKLFKTDLGYSIFLNVVQLQAYLILKIRMMDLKIIMKQDSSELRLTRHHARPLLSKAKKKRKRSLEKALSVSQDLGFLSDGLVVLGLTSLPASDVGLSLGKLLKQARRNDESYRMCSCRVKLSVPVFSFKWISVTHLFGNFTLLLILIREITEDRSH